MPTTMMVKSMPSSRWMFWNVKRGTALIGSSPIMATQSPTPRLRNPLIMSSPPRTVTRQSASTMTAVISTGPKASAACATQVDRKVIRMRLINPPVKEAYTAMPSARPASPFWASG